MLTWIVFFLVLSILVLVHEFGHFIVGRLLGIGVLEFALGLPFTRPLWSKKLKSGMRLSLYPIFFGGFVKLLGEDGPSGGNPDKVRGKQFFTAPVWHRIAVVVAGVVMNLILAIAVFYAFLAMAGFKVIVPRLTEYNFLSPTRAVIVVTGVAPDSPAQAAGLHENDVVLDIDGRHFGTRAEFRKYVLDHSGTSVNLKVSDLDVKKERQISVVPRVNPPADQGAIGIGLGEGVLVTYETTQEKMFSGVTYGADMFVYNVKVLSFLISTSFAHRDVAPVADNLSGPVGIFNNIGDILKLPFEQRVMTMLNFLGLLSLSLAFMNILPIPAMDGGRLAFLLVEAFTKKKLPDRYEGWINQAGMIFLLGLIVLISYNDVKRNYFPKCNAAPEVMKNVGLCNSVSQ